MGANQGSSGGETGADVVLLGGNTNTVVRVGDTVRRTAGAWTPTVQALLRRLERAGFEAAPRPLGVDDQGREVLSYIEGSAVSYPMPAYVWDDATLADAGRLLRRYHDLTVDFDPSAARWRPYAVVSGPSEVICHCDWGPYNARLVSGVTGRLEGRLEAGDGAVSHG